MSKRVVLLTDEEIDLVLAWGDVTRTISTAPVIERLNILDLHDVILHDFEEDDQMVYETLKAARLAG